MEIETVDRGKTPALKKPLRCFRINLVHEEKKREGQRWSTVLGAQ